MSFYLLKSTINRQQIGDALINLFDIDMVGIVQIKFKDRVDPIYNVIVQLKSDNRFKANFATLEDAKAVIKEMLGEKISDAALADMLPQVYD